MNSNIPDYWLVLSSIYFVVSTLVMLGLGVAIYQIVKLVKDLSPTVKETSGKVQQVIGKVEELTVKVNGIADKVDGIASNVQGMSNTAKSSVERFSTGANQAAGLLEVVNQRAGKNLDKYAPYLSMALTAYKLFNAFRDSRAKSNGSAAPSKTKDKRPSAITKREEQPPAFPNGIRSESATDVVIP